ncbi:glycine receptor subunit alpha-2 isoform X1 [Amyelois transitella]|uniref:glycine receptor subunit alpha-2 isoform X1 n=2 Tax=Amyelois transitella TaxID=680683 RepID=UPI00067C1D1F|nr:glycine receptor subunit alpha-2 isoform X1 [Amyelois transitella]
MWKTFPVVLGLIVLGGGASFNSQKELLECASQILYMDQHSYQIPTNYNRNIPPGKNTTVYIGVNVNRVSGVDENREEITLDVFLQASWEDMRLHVPPGMNLIDLPWEFRQLIWTPDLYIYQLQSMKILSVFNDMASLRLYSNGTVSVSIGATITIKCEMDFVLYPLDVQNCAIDFSSYKYTTEDIRFEWRDVAAWRGLASGPGQRSEFRLPKYVVTFVTDKSNHIRTYGEGDHSAARLQIKLSRELRSYLLESYLPSTLFVIISWGSFCVIPEIVPGRMVLLVTTLLSLVTMFDTVSTNSPDALELKCIEVWLIWCTIFVFLALMEYFVVLFGIRYDKSWCQRRQDLRRAASAVQLAPQLTNHAQRLSTPVTGTPQGAVFTPQLSVEDEGLKQQFSHQTIQRDSPMLEAMAMQSPATPTNTRARIASLIERAIMFCGAQHGSLDRFALMLFPMSFLLFNIIYWTAYLYEAHQRNNK